MEILLFIQQNLWILVLLAIWSIPWKGWALWKAAKANDKRWFIALLVVNTVAILEIYYIFVLGKKRKPVR